MDSADSQTVRRGRPPTIGPRELEVIALRLFLSKGFDETTVEDIATQGGITRRSFHRYFSNKADVLWHGFDNEIDRLSQTLAESDQSLRVIDAVRSAVLLVNHYKAGDVEELRRRMELIGSVPALQASAASRYDAWEMAVAEFVAGRMGQPVASLYPLIVGRTVLAACRTAFDLWLVQGDDDLVTYLDEALATLAIGFGDLP